MWTSLATGKLSNPAIRIIAKQQLLRAQTKGEKNKMLGDKNR